MLQPREASPPLPGRGTASPPEETSGDTKAVAHLPSPFPAKWASDWRGSRLPRRGGRGQAAGMCPRALVCPPLLRHSLSLSPGPGHGAQTCPCPGSTQSEGHSREWSWLERGSGGCLPRLGACEGFQEEAVCAPSLGDKQGTGTGGRELVPKQSLLQPALHQAWAGEGHWGPLTGHRSTERALENSSAAGVRNPHGQVSDLGQRPHTWSQVGPMRK